MITNLSKVMDVTITTTIISNTKRITQRSEFDCDKNIHAIYLNSKSLVVHLTPLIILTMVTALLERKCISLQ